MGFLKNFLVLTFLTVVFHANVNAYKLDQYKKFVEEFLTKPEYKTDFANNVKRLVEKEPNYFNYSPFKVDKQFTFDCNTQEFSSAIPPKSVHELRPGDINVVAALGDSITAACGADADTVIGLMTEYRERSWSMGGRDSLEEIVSLPNILKKFNSQLKGASMRNNLINNGKEGKEFNLNLNLNNLNKHRLLKKM